MKYFKRILLSIIFVVGLVLLLVVLSKILTPKNNIADYNMEEIEANGILGEPENTIDVLILGDSEAYMSMIPLQIWNEKGITSYNCGTSSQTLYYSKALLERTFENQSPKVVILETDCIFIAHNIDDVVISELKETFPIFRYHDRWKSLESIDFTEDKDYNYTDGFKGYRLNNSCLPADTNGYMSYTDEVAPIEDANMLELKAIKKLCDDNGAKLVFVSVPSVTNWNFSRHNAIVQLSESFGCDYIDMNLLTEEVPIDWETETKDQGDHMNYFGAVKVTSFLSDYLENTGFFISHKGDPEYQVWEDTWLAFDKIYK